MNRPFPLQSHGAEYVFVDSRVLAKDKQLNDRAAWEELDPLVCDDVVNLVARGPEGLVKLRSLWALWHGRAPDARVKNGQVTWDLIQFIERKQLVVLKRVAQPVAQLVHDAPKTVKQEPIKADEPLEYVWRWECAHHAKGERSVIDDKLVYQVVPSEGTTETVRLHLKEKLKRPPPHVLVSPGQKVGSNGLDRGYTVYPLELKWQGEYVKSFLPTHFWQNYKRIDSYSISGGPPGLQVQVFHPCHYKLQMHLPPCKEYKTGAKLGDIGKATKSLFTGKKGPKVWHPDKGNKPWDSSNLDLNLKTLERFQYSRDGVQVQVPLLEALGEVLGIAQRVTELIDAVRDKVPKVGWYMDFSFKLLEGALALEWYWKEHTDHRVFQYIDFASKLTLVGATLEVGFGAAGVMFKLQFYFSLEGEVSIEASCRRGHPDCVVGGAIPFGASFKAALGARVEAGHLAKIDVRGETALELEGELKLNQSPSAMLGFEASIKWTGLAGVATVSLGPNGVAGETEYSREFIDPVDLGSVQWPGQKYEPPTMSRAAIASVLEDVLTNGTNVRVWGAKGGWGVELIADVLARAMDAYDATQKQKFLRTSRSVEGIAHAIRADLDEIAADDKSTESHWLMTYITEAKFHAYVASDKFKKHVRDAVNPADAIVAA